MKVLLSAYSCEPNAGSEAGAGYSILRAAAELAECWVITRANNVEPLGRALTRDPPSHPVHIVPLDVSERTLRLKRRFGAIRPYYALWQRAVASKGIDLDAQYGGFDVVHHATMSAFWMPIGVTRLDRPLVVGPISGGTFTPLQLAPMLGMRRIVTDSIRYVNAHIAARLTRKTWHRAKVVIAQNWQMESFAARHLEVEGRLLVQSHASNPSVSNVANVESRKPVVLFVGRLVAWKGILLALEAFRRVGVPEARLVFVGDGPDRALLERRIDDFGYSSLVEILGSVPRLQVLKMMREASCLLFPSFHDSAGFVVSEALALGLPVVCLDQGGPAWLVNHWSHVPSVAVQPSTLDETISSLTISVRRFLLEPVPIPSEITESDQRLGVTLREAYTLAAEDSAS
jgi:glycosyltransferase involved in cell wall biosynthesis